MRSLRRNKQKIYYALNTGEAAVYAKDSNGDVIYDTMPDGTSVARVTGGKTQTYGTPTEAWVNIAVGAAALKASPYGFNFSGYTGVKEFDAKMVTMIDEYPINEGALIWFQSDPPDEVTYATEADYVVIAAYNTLNESSFVLQKQQR